MQSTVYPQPGSNGPFMGQLHQLICTPGLHLAQGCQRRLSITLPGALEMLLSTGAESDLLRGRTWNLDFEAAQVILIITVLTSSPHLTMSHHNTLLLILTVPSPTLHSRCGSSFITSMWPSQSPSTEISLSHFNFTFKSA